MLIYPYTTQHRLFRFLLMIIALKGLPGCSHSEQATEYWMPINAENIDSRIEGVWENIDLGHVIQFDPNGYTVIHHLDDYCVSDPGVVPSYALFAFGAEPDELLLQYFDYRDNSMLLQKPLAFRRVSEIPLCITSLPKFERVSPSQIFDLLWRSFDRYYAFFNERQIDWNALREEYRPKASKSKNEDELFVILSKMLSSLEDSHVNLYLKDRSFNAGGGQLRARLGDIWENGHFKISEREFVSDWHRRVNESVYDVLDPGSLKSGAAGALEWGTIGKTVGYLRINRFGGFTQKSVSRPKQYVVLQQALDEMIRDLADTKRVVVDVSLNGGGSDAAALLVASRFTDTPRRVVGYQVPGGPVQWLHISPAKSVYPGAIYLLTSEVTASAAESFVLMMRAFPRITHVGQSTRGGLSSLLPKPLPNDFLVTIAYQKVLDAEGRLYEVVGIPPQRPIELFPSDNLYLKFGEVLRQLAAE